MISYIAKNKVNGKSYIGITSKTLNERIKAHVTAASKSNFYFHKAIRKYGIESFSWSVIKKYDSIDEMKDDESRLICELNTYAPNGFGYNSTLGGDGCVGYKFTEEDKIKISLAGKGKKKSAETRKKLSEANKGKKPSFDQTGIKRSEETKRKISENHVGFSGKTWSNEQREKITSWMKVASENGMIKNQKLRSSDFQDISEMISNGVSYKDIGAKYGCTAAAICYFLKRNRK